MSEEQEKLDILPDVEEILDELQQVLSNYGQVKRNMSSLRREEKELKKALAELHEKLPPNVAVDIDHPEIESVKRIVSEVPGYYVEDAVRDYLSIKLKKN